MTAKKTASARKQKPTTKADATEAYKRYSDWQQVVMAVLDRLRDDAYDVLDALDDPACPLHRHLDKCTLKELARALSDAACQAVGSTPQYGPCPLPIPRPIGDAAA